MRGSGAGLRRGGFLRGERVRSWCGDWGWDAGGDDFVDAGLDLVDGGFVADGDDAMGFAGGDLFVFFVDAAVEVVGLALEAVFVGALFAGRGAGCGGGLGGGRLRGMGGGGG